MSRPRAVEIVEARADGPPLDRALRITIHFHPGRVTNGRTVLEHLVTDRSYRTQFETGTSNGGLTAHPGGDRWRWEHRMFAGTYDEAPAAARPRYGALNHRRRRVGAAPRFGSAHLRLTAPVLGRATFCFPDSVFEPTALATADRFGLWPLVEEFERLQRDDRRERAEGGLLDDYVEAHVHGGLDLDTDVEALVLDPAHRGTELERTADRLGVAVEWHGGFRVHVDTLAQHPHFRGPEVVGLAHQVAQDGWLDPVILDRARGQGRHDPQQLKLLWHCVARFGSDWR
ncbi:DUF3626 domain-containing protein [Ornithinimicrobium faecis]|uniref:DUF3626 domain-containing protein n=1 Tax=Ornithinimicrobium faecis TaxID=2934158 RepID=A0ABY4YQI7_9MICO|nr:MULTISPECIES: DUF3626 domain-containing protein [unclassified Ornithinimicrobium]USQ78530.1 DUF3626 domain-containing protein [Ornithinimicrobium sp. HY1793]